jgi:hypothetical protein
MNTLGTAVTGGGGASDFAFDADLGRAVNPQATQFQKTAADGTATAITFTSAGGGYPIGEDILVEQSATTGSGTGLTALVTTVQNAAGDPLVVGSSIPNTGSFDNSQNQVVGGYAKTSAGARLTQVSSAVVGTSATGSAAEFLVTIDSGTVRSVSVSVAGSGYKAGDIVTITKANLETALGSGSTVEYDLLIGPLVSGDINGELSTTIQLLDGGKGHSATDVITLTAAGSSLTGTGTVTVSSVQAGDVLGANPMLSYPTGIRIAEGTTGAPKTVAFVGMDDVNVVIGGFVTGQLLPFQFKQILTSGTDATLGLITIFYGGN